MTYQFKAWGHKNITARHRNTFEFTKDENVTLEGDCIAGVKADFSLEMTKEFIKSLKTNKIRIIIEAGGQIEEINAEINKGFNSGQEIVIRKTGFISERTLAVNADKAAKDFSRELSSMLKRDDIIKVYFTGN